MTQEDKGLLLKELCARLPYRLICTDLRHGDSRITEIDVVSEVVYFDDVDEYVEIKNCKPYLRPMSSMTEEEEMEIRKINSQFINGLLYSGVFSVDDGGCTIIEMAEILNLLNAHHLDYYGLIPKGLALEVKEGMYNIK